MIAGFYTYIHRRADDGLVFYVGKWRGKTISAEQRAKISASLKRRSAT